MKSFDQESVTSVILKSGVLLSLFLIVLGTLMIFIMKHADNLTLSQIADIYSTTIINSSQISLGDLLSGSLSLDGIYLISLGLWVLIFTPISVVFVGIIDFELQKNYRYVIMALVVLFNLFFAMLVIG
ncbi:MAG: DUF1634 domain-containing protein [Candidatus Thermoplasmatota archaeon]|jgi:uncharacterized membrane protein|nr:DUF1634 domain-containing protein [Candidatus Thermoplasmatota archaeon]MCL5793734.1 DUF1634 domain-containing protein [Candidatus Thermoplasmatota archaeon]